MKALVIALFGLTCALSGAVAFGLWIAWPLSPAEILGGELPR